jgi:ribokinase
MANPAVEGLRSVFLKLRTRQGLTAERLRGTEVDTALLADLPAVQEHVRNAGVPVEEAIVAVVESAVARLDPTDRLIACAVLALDVLHDRVSDHQELRRLYAEDLGDRRTALVVHWTALHALLRVPAPPTPTVRTLRGSIENRVLGVLAGECADVSATTESPVPVPGDDRSASVLVVGTATRDFIAQVNSLPTPGTSVQATSLSAHPGGKGLNLAVATARMGLAVRFAAAIGSDEAAGDVLDVMRAEGMTTNLIKEVPNAGTPTAFVMVRPNGDSATIGWKNEERVSLTTADLQTPPMVHALSSAVAVLVTFELPVHLMRRVLELARQSPSKPLILLQASPPLEQPQQLYGQLPGVDYVVGTEWALRSLLLDNGVDQTFDEVANQLIALGISTVCVVEKFGCRIRSRALHADISSPSVPLDDMPGSREAFSSALVDHLLRNDRVLDRAALEWACAAMSTNLTVNVILDSMPVRDDVKRIMEPGNKTAG